MSALFRILDRNHNRVLDADDFFTDHERQWVEMRQHAAQACPATPFYIEPHNLEDQLVTLGVSRRFVQRQEHLAIIAETTPVPETPFIERLGAFFEVLGIALAYVLAGVAFLPSLGHTGYTFAPLARLWTSATGRAFGPPRDTRAETIQREMSARVRAVDGQNRLVCLAEVAPLPAPPPPRQTSGVNSRCPGGVRP